MFAHIGKEAPYLLLRATEPEACKLKTQQALYGHLDPGNKTTDEATTTAPEDHVEPYSEDDSSDEEESPKPDEKEKTTKTTSLCMKFVILPHFHARAQ